MIPVRLVIKDFLSYGEPEPVDFTLFDVACLTGDNGVGKSAFLDAISWALFGAARGCENGQNQDRVIRDGSDEALIDFTFALGDATYRIVRKRSKTRGDVRFMIGDGDDWTNVAGETMRETEERIRSTLRMDYETFTASAFFVQGRAEDFLSRMKPDQRKEIFASLLDLGVYEKLEEAARAKARDAETRRAAQAQRVEELTAGAVDVGTVRTEAAAATERANELQSEAAQAESVVVELRTKLSELEAVKASADGEEKLIASLRTNRERTAASLLAKQKDVETLDELIAHSDDVRQAVEELERLRREDDALREKERAAGKLREREAEIRERIKAEHDTIVRRIDDTTKALAAATKERTTLERAEGDLTKLVASLENVQDAPATFEDVRGQLDLRRADEARLLETIRGSDARLAELDEHAAILGRGGGECPVCGTELDAKHRKEAVSRLRADVRSFGKERDGAVSALEDARKDIKRSSEELDRLRKAVAEREQLAASVDAVRARLERLPIVLGDIEALEAQRDADANRVTKGLVAPELEVELTAVAKERVALYDEDAHKDVVRRVEKLRPAEEMWVRVATATEQRPLVLKEIAGAQEHLAELDSQIDERRRAHDALTKRLADLPAAQEAVTRADERREGLRTAVVEAAALLARLEERIAGAERTERELAEAREAELSAATEHRRYRRLMEAFGRGGIPDLVIDNVRPELEDEANDVLGRLTDYEMDVRFHLKRSTKAGKEKDTFDVLVHHGGGVPRDFAMFSGGEAFRIAFAVRLAMSKLLVRRAGAQLETLVIDEGFGTQDPEGRERLVEAINLARREFGKVLVITHLDELKDAFGTQIRVTKDDRKGSVLEVVRG